MLSADPDSQASCLLLFKSYTGNIEAVDLPVSADQTPYGFMMATADVFTTKVSKAMRIFYRCILLKRVVVSTVTLSRASSPSRRPIYGEYYLSSDFVITGYTHDAILTSAIREPAVLGDVGPDGFFALYRDIIAEGRDFNGTRMAILIHLEDEPVAVKAFRVLGSVVSVALGLTAAIAF
ncbi:hypothetical protein ACJ41O_001059 [Fusarium nematophilum]